MADSYRSPILAQIFYVIGWISLLGTVLLLIAGIIAAQHARRHGYEDSPLSTYWLIFLPTVSGLFSTLVIFGIGQVIDFIGQTAFYSFKIFEVVNHADTMSGSRWRDVQTALNGIAANGKKSAPASTPASPAPARSTTASAKTSAAARYFYVDLDNQVAGPVSASKLRDLVADGSVGDETQICPEGSEDWRAFADTALS